MATAAQDILDAIEATILKLASGQHQSVSFNGQSFTKRDMKSLTEQRAYWKAEVLRSDTSDTANRDGRVRIAFVGNNQPFSRNCD